MLDFYYFSQLRSYATLRHSISTKDTSYPYGFSLALHTKEDTKAILKNRKLLFESFANESFHVVVANQTHSANIHIVTIAKSQGWKTQKNAISNCDALITNQKNIVLSILTADCVPILLYDPIQEVIAAVHAGWRGTKEHIVSKTVKKMIESFDSNAEDIIAGIAPSIGQCCYEVGADVAINFKHLPHAYTTKNDRFMLNLPKINQQQLCDIGVLSKNIEMSHICTSCEVERFFSYRKEKKCSGRFMSTLVLIE